MARSLPIQDVDRDYYLKRADVERDLAEAAASDVARITHSILAGLYLDRVFREPSGNGDGR